MAVLKSSWHSNVADYRNRSDSEIGVTGVLGSEACDCCDDDAGCRVIDRESNCGFNALLCGNFTAATIKLVVVNTLHQPRPQEPHLATIQPVDSRPGGSVLSIFNLLLNSALMIVFQSSWVVAFLVAVTLLKITSFLGALAIAFVLFLLCAQITLVFTYPEWPINRLLVKRFRRSLQSRTAPLVSASDADHRVVELVPRERWRRMSLETATDLMLIRVDGSGVWMTGDRNEYALPKESILGAELTSIQPPGWCTSTHMVVLTVRTAQGPIELPISYRDHRFGNLANKTRRQQAAALTEQINGLACGLWYEPPILSPEAAGEPAPQLSRNPYAAPTGAWS